MKRLQHVIEPDADGNDADDWLAPETLALYQELTTHSRYS
jgi:hypothetical protein